ncbi:Aste57867_12388 [Aphanomyces stellatus]|uniref:Microsomal glutathione S-transferase 1 n=1 Tax=Aphanomyces stellatus TaxID=120398 RepID=A0A485KVE4_9STRA|nr:hypothetical protein As57867_012342 [Aphanomyces stellatus]VFT89239.1 Aste57867_12388 [Aphanomyces stellatus]
MVCTATLFFKHFVTGFIGAKAKFVAGKRAPEDSGNDGKQNFGTFPADEKKDKKLEAAVIAEQRWNRITMNDLENIPIGLITAWAAIASGGDANTIAYALITFTVARVGHTIAYANALAAPRGLAYLVGSATIFVLAGTGLSAVFR